MAEISPLRRRMIEDMTIRGLADKTQTGYIRHIKNFSTFFGRSPDQATAEDVRLYQLHMKTSGASVGTMAGAFEVQGNELVLHLLGGACRQQQRGRRHHSGAFHHRAS